MIDIEQEELLTLLAAARRLPHGRASKPVHVATLHRWCSHGLAGGARLETVKIGGVRYTSTEALERFIENCSATNEPTALTTRSRQREIARAESELDKAGI